MVAENRRFVRQTSLTHLQAMRRRSGLSWATLVLYHAQKIFFEEIDEANVRCKNDDAQLLNLKK